jgi:hypothetical protein
MQGVTLTFALIASLLVITLRPQYALAVFITALLWYPSFLAVSVGTIDILIGRFVDYFACLSLSPNLLQTAHFRVSFKK